MNQRVIFLLTTLLAFSLSGSLQAAKNKEANALALKGTEAAKNGNWDEAVEDLRKATEKDHKYSVNLAAALQGRAAVYVGEQKLKEAAADYDEAIKLNSHNASAYEAAASVAIKLKDLDKAVQMYSGAIKVNPDESRYYLYRSYVYELKGDVKDAMADTEKVLSLQKDNADALARKARLQARQAQSAPFASPPPAASARPHP